jgi:hypothetical protein
MDVIQEHLHTFEKNEKCPELWYSFCTGRIIHASKNVLRSFKAGFQTYSTTGNYYYENTGRRLTSNK